MLTTPICSSANQLMGRFAVTADLHTGFPGYELLIDNLGKDLVEEGDTMVIHGHVRGVHQGEFAGIAPTGRHIDVSALLIYQLANGQASEFRIQIDLPALAQQLKAGNAGNGDSQSRKCSVRVHKQEG